ncbi:hypothetical protein [Nocardia sp. NPDC004711]
MQTGTQGGDTTVVTEEPALVTALAAPLVKLRAALGTGARPDDTALAALTAVPATVRAADDTHQSGVTTLTATETAKQAHPVIKQTGTEVAALSDVGDNLAPLLTSAYDTRDKAASDLDTLISDFKAQATPLVKAARSQADLDSVVSLAADYTQNGVGVVKAADGQMDQYTAKVKDIADTTPVVTTPDTGGGTSQPANTNYPNPSNTTGGGTNTQYPTNGQNTYYGNNSGYGNSNYNSGTGTSYTGGSDYTNSKLAETNPELAAQLTIQSAALSAGVTIGSALITGAVTLGSALITSGASVLTTGIEKAEAYGEKQLAATTTQTGGTPATTQTGGGTQTGGNSLTPGLADPGTGTGGGTQTGGNLTPGLTDPGTTPRTTTLDPSAAGGGNTPQAAQPAPQSQPQAGAAPDTGGTVVPPITGKPTTPGTDDTKKRNGQAGTTA